MFRYLEVPTAANLPMFGAPGGLKISRWNLPDGWVNRVITKYGLELEVDAAPLLLTGVVAGMGSTPHTGDSNSPLNDSSVMIGSTVAAESAPVPVVPPVGRRWEAVPVPGTPANTPAESSPIEAMVSGGFLPLESKIDAVEFPPL